MPLRGQGALAIWNAITPEAEQDFYRWHNTEHIPERVGVPGFLRGRRYLNWIRPRDYFTLYETATAETIGSPPYIARLNDPTPWTQRVVPHFRETVRVGCRVAASTGQGQGGALLTVRFHLAPARADAARAWLSGAGLRDAAETDGVVGAHVLEPVAEVSRIETAEKKIRGGVADAGPSLEPWIVLVEANGADVVEALGRGLLSPDRLAAEGAQPGAVAGVYRLQFALDRG